MTIDAGAIAGCRTLLAQLVGAWDFSGRPPQTSYGWKPDHWSQWFPDDKPFLRTLPKTIDRDSVRARFLNPWKVMDAREAFIATMIWGFGSTGYGPWRTAKILRQQGAEKKLGDVVQITRDQGPLAGYKALASRESCRLHGLGPAFGTKFLCVAAIDEPAPVLDALVSGWLRKHSGGAIAIGHRGWVLGHYETYIDVMGLLTEAVLDDINDTEYLIFADAAAHLSKRPGLWHEPWVPAE